jgi:hypothetical protein
MELLGDVCQMEALLARLEVVLISAHDHCTVCAKCTIGMEIVLGAPDVIPR